jgi:hypothetical protein
MPIVCRLSVCVYVRLFSFWKYFSPARLELIQTEITLQNFIFQKCQKMEKFFFSFLGDVLVRLRGRKWGKQKGQQVE